ncbi:MAG: MBL fold metallo-hydrolase [Hyphomicrobiales bacterium]|nr:MBL fold metallo-hydrolase [Hyphomicrobiales bacterium]
MTSFICVTCGTQFSATEAPPSLCPICTDDRQFVGWKGQAWTTLEKLHESHKLRFEHEDEGVTGIGIEPHFGIGQRALLVQTPRGNVLWDCVALVNEEAMRRIEALGGLKAIAISHPHYYTVMAEWGDAVGGIPIYLHEDDREWVMREHHAIAYWRGDAHEFAPGMTLIRCGGHFPGATVMHWAQGAKGQGAVFGGDVIAVNMDRASVSFMHSFPNYIPLGARAVRHIAEIMRPYRFEKIFGAFARRNVMVEGRTVFERSIVRYLEAIGASA